MSEKKLIGIFRHIDKPYGKIHKYKIITIGHEKFVPMMEVLEETGVIQYPREYYEALRTSTSTKKIKNDNGFKFVPDKLQPLYYIYEYTYNNGRVFVEAKFCKTVDHRTWKTYPYYDKRTINLIH